MSKSRLIVDVDDEHVIVVMKRLKKLGGVLAVDLDLGVEVAPRPRKNGATRNMGTHRMTLLRGLADGKPHPYDELRAAVGQEQKRFHNTRYNAVRDEVVRIPRKGFLQITARGQAILKEKQG